MKLYEITEQLRELMAMDDVPPEQLQDTLDMIQDDFDGKAMQVAAFIREMELEAGAYKAEADRLTERKRAIEAKVESMKDYLRTNMEATGTTKIKGKLFSITLGKPSEIVRVGPVEKLPAGYIRVKEEADKDAIKRALKEGLEVPECELAHGKAKLIIR